MIGHARTREALEAELPPVVLLYGPPDIGKRTLGRHILLSHGALDIEIREIRELDVGRARDLVRFAQAAPMGEIRPALVDIDGAGDAIHVLLKLFEEPPPKFRAIVTSSEEPPLTIVSRAVTYHLWLSEAEIAQILMEEHNILPAQARLAARQSGGSVRRALAVDEYQGVKGQVLTVLRSVQSGDQELLSRVLSGDQFDSRHIQMLRAWAHEARTGVWRAFDPVEDFGMHKNAQMVERVRVGLRSRAHPKILARAVFAPLVEASRG